MPVVTLAVLGVATAILAVILNGPTGLRFFLAEKGSCSRLARNPARLRCGHLKLTIGSCWTFERPDLPAACIPVRRLQAYQLSASLNGDIWVYDLGDGGPGRPLTNNELNIISACTPDGERLAFTSPGGGEGELLNLHWRRGDGDGDSERLLERLNRQYPADWGDDGSIVFSGRSRAELSTVASAGGTCQLLTTLANPGDASAQFAYSHQGTLVYLPGEATRRLFTLNWLDQEGGTKPLRDVPAAYGQLSLAPGSQRLAVGIHDGAQDIWVYEWERDTLTRPALDAANNHAPVWSPNGDSLVFRSTRVGNLYWKRANGRVRTHGRIPQHAPWSGNCKQAILLPQRHDRTAGFSPLSRIVCSCLLERVRRSSRVRNRD